MKERKQIDLKIIDLKNLLIIIFDINILVIGLDVLIINLFSLHLSSWFSTLLGILPSLEVS